MFTLFDSFASYVIPTTATVLVIVGMILLAALDVWRREVEDAATVALLIVAIWGLLVDGISAGQWIAGVLSAAIAFMIYLGLGVRGAIGGGDVKLSVVPALALGASNPFLGIWWVAASIAIQQAFFLVARRGTRVVAGHGGPTALVLPHVPAMASAMLLATVLFPTAL